MVVEVVVRLCHPSTFLSFLRSLSVRRRKDERLDAIAVDGGRSLEGGGGLKDEEVWVQE
jgi:hypothetical protein